ncbi:MAG TPA: hypothetical protein VFN25_10425, partial [Dokdonella sp.]|uniref:hypothetical protein n=1 Tax=Dokdonella sp. TaxID=2291710 RepID=UPI002D7F9704
AADNAAAWPRDAEIPLTDVRSVPKTGLARPPPTQQTARKGRLNFLYAQFDVYRNYRLRSLSGTRAMGGAIFTAVAGAADRKNSKALDLERFAIRSDPGDGRWNPDENQVGCDGRGEGEYYASEVNGGSDVVVIWLKFAVDDKLYSFRSAYQYHFDEAASLTGEDKIKEAIEMTIASIASKIVL